MWLKSIYFLQKGGLQNVGDKGRKLRLESQIKDSTFLNYNYNKGKK
ncbi:MAG: hypothetical protein SOW25_05725 [Helicobacter sp.]|nr:hypothetical protein [Helicobacter sp.]